jgi:hypothetical protein
VELAIGDDLKPVGVQEIYYAVERVHIEKLADDSRLNPWPHRP